MMKTITLPIILMAALTSGCVPSLCLFNCGGTTTTEQRTHRWEDNTTFMQDGVRWRCQLSKDDIQHYNAFRAKDAICQTVMP